MKKITYASTSVLFGLCLTACGDDGANAGDTESATGGSTSGDSESGETTMSTSSTTTSAGSTTDPTGGECSAADECMVDADCAGDQTCISCICVGEVGCEGDRPVGAYGDCLTDAGSVDISACEGGAMPGCIVDDTSAPTGGSCIFQGCTDTESACDCPAGPPGFEDQVVCGNLTSDMSNDCYLSCEGGAACPEGAFCESSLFCVYGEQVTLDPYGDCFNEAGTCPGDMGVCAGDSSTFGVCSTPCTDVGDCADAPETGDAPVICSDWGGGFASEICTLDCSGGETCPDGMRCFEDIACVWQGPNPGFGDCINADEGAACSADEECFNVAGSPNNGVCSANCATPADCPDAPDTGDAPVACAEVNGAAAGADCYLDCSSGQTCPDGMVCVDTTQCMFEEQSVTFEEDFQGGLTMPADWVTYDEDGNTVNPELAALNIDEAWVIFNNDGASANNSALSTSYYMPAGTSDDWLVTPQIAIGSNATLRWLAASLDADFPDGYEVRINMVGNAVGDFSAAPVFTIAAENLGGITPPTMTSRSLNLADAGFQNVSIYVAFRNITNDGLLLLVDEVRVTE